MARLVRRIVQNDHPTDPSLTPHRSNVGDIVEIVEDDHKFSEIELNCGHYDFIDLPGAHPEKVEHLRKNLKNKDGEIVQRYVKALDVKAVLSLPPHPKALIDLVEAQKVVAEEYKAKRKDLADAILVANAVADKIKTRLALHDPKKLRVALHETIHADPEFSEVSAVVDTKANIERLASLDLEIVRADTQNAIAADPKLKKHVDDCLAAIAAITIDKPILVKFDAAPGDLDAVVI